MDRPNSSLEQSRSGRTFRSRRFWICGPRKPSSRHGALPQRERHLWADNPLDRAFRWIAFSAPLSERTNLVAVPGVEPDQTPTTLFRPATRLFFVGNCQRMNRSGTYASMAAYVPLLTPLIRSNDLEVSCSSRRMTGRAASSFGPRSAGQERVDEDAEFSPSAIIAAFRSLPLHVVAPMGLLL